MFRRCRWAVADHIRFRLCVYAYSSKGLKTGAHDIACLSTFIVQRIRDYDSHFFDIRKLLSTISV